MLLEAKDLITRLGTAQPQSAAPRRCFLPADPCQTAYLGRSLHLLRGFLLCLAMLSPAAAQEDVAETKAQAQIDTTPITEPPITAADREHWSFAPLQRHPQPRTKHSGSLRSPIDAFILARLEAGDLQLAKEADRPALLRRLTFDLTGLPPSPDDLVELLSPSSAARPDWYERYLDQLLASPAFGDRYAQYWLDLARFAETDGYEHDKVRPNAWKYRDWLIAALNADLPYDEFIRQQLAGDEASGFTFSLSEHRDAELPAELPAADPKSKHQNPKAEPLSSGQIASMFCLAGPDMPDVNDQLERRHVLLNELTSAVGATFLGLQLGCAQCHNHKYDPLSQADFYRLRAVFEPAVATLQRDQPYNVLANQKDPATPRFWIRGDHRRPGLEVQPAFPRIASLPAPQLTERLGSNSENPSRALRSGARSELAAWLVRPENPLTSRVIANRLWQWHFGCGLCQTPSDLGVMGGPLTHPELLDWLALELKGGGWSMKRLHRAIVSSSTYRQSSENRISPAADAQSPDPDNALYSRFPRQRLSGEAIRDSLLAAAGLLTSERGGPGVMPPLPEELLSTLLKNQWTASKRQSDHYKRSIYVFARRNLRYPLFEAFDRPDANATCPVRNRSTTAPQSLLLFNSELSLLAARHLAARIANTPAGSDTPVGRDKSVRWDKLAPASAGPPSASPKTPPTTTPIERLYLLTLSRRPTAAESAALEEFLAAQQRRLAAESRPREELALPEPCPESISPYAAAALVDACLAILNTNEFIYID